MGHPLSIQDTYDVLICHIGHSKGGCRIIMVSKKGLALGIYDLSLVTFTYGNFGGFLSCVKLKESQQVR